MLNLSSNNFYENGVKKLAEALQSNTTLTMLDLSYSNIDYGDASALANALRSNSTLTLLNLSDNKLYDAVAIALIAALKVNTTLTSLNLRFNSKIDSKLLQEINNLLERNRQQLLTYAAASLDLLVRHSPTLSHVDVPKELLPLIAEQLSHEVLAAFGQEWKQAFSAPPLPITTTTTNATTTATTTTTTTTTTDSTIPTTLTTSSAATATGPASAPQSIAVQIATAADITALLADPNPVVALSRWIDGQANPAAGLNWVDPANGYTLLHYAVEAQQGAVVRSLMARGIDRTKVDHNNQTAAQLAQQRADSSSSQAVAAIAAILS